MRKHRSPMTPKKVTVPNEVMLGAATALVKEGHTAVIMTKGNSMLPFIRGERDSVELSAPGKPEPGQIALAQIAPGRYVLHRIIEVDGDAVVLKGDGNLVGVEKCSADDICAIATKIFRPGRRPKDCTTEKFARRSLRWRNLPYTVRRYTLGIYRRLKFL